MKIVEYMKNVEYVVVYVEYLLCSVAQCVVPQVSSPVSQPLFTYDTIRRDSYSRLDSDASSLGHSLSPTHQVGHNHI